MEPEGLLPRSQQLAPCPYPEPDQSSPCSTSHFWNITFNIILHLRLGLPSGPFPSGLHTKTPHAPLLFPVPIRATLPAHLILINLLSRIISVEVLKFSVPPFPSISI